jgi:hypothetical protein
LVFSVSAKSKKPKKKQKMRRYVLSANAQYTCRGDKCTLQLGKRNGAQRGAAEEEELGPFRPSWIDKARCNQESDCVDKKDKKCVTVNENGRIVPGNNCNPQGARCILGHCGGFCSQDPDVIKKYGFAAHKLPENTNLDQHYAQCQTDADCHVDDIKTSCRRCVVAQTDADKKQGKPIQYQLCNMYSVAQSVQAPETANRCINFQCHSPGEGPGA